MATKGDVRKADGGYGSRKFWLAVATSAAVVGCALYAGAHPSFGSYLGTTDNALLWCLAIYAGANVGSQHAFGRLLGKLPKGPGPRPPGK